MIIVHTEGQVYSEYNRPDPQPWMAEKNCGGVDPELFFERVNAVDAPAKKYCKPCPVKTECLLFALVTENPSEQRYGYFGNMSPIERQRLYDELKERNK